MAEKIEDYRRPLPVTVIVSQSNPTHNPKDRPETVKPPKQTKTLGPYRQVN